MCRFTLLVSNLSASSFIITINKLLFDSPILFSTASLSGANLVTVANPKLILFFFSMVAEMARTKHSPIMAISVEIMNIGKHNVGDINLKWGNELRKISHEFCCCVMCEGERESWWT